MARMTIKQVQDFIPQLIKEWNTLREQVSAIMRLLDPEQVQEEIQAERERQKTAANQQIQATVDEGVANGWLSKSADDAEVTGGEVVIFSVDGSQGTIIPAVAPQGHVFTGTKVGQGVKLEDKDAVVLAHYAYDRALHNRKQQEVIQAREAAVAAMKAESAVATGPQAPAAALEQPRD